MSQVLTEHYDINNDVENNNQPEWNKLLANNGVNINENCGVGINVYNGSETAEDEFTEKNNSKHSSKQGDSRFSNVQDGLESSISSEGKERVQRILNDVNHLSDVEKLLLYLKLPTGATPDESLRQTPTSFLHSSNRIEQAQAFTWIRSHLEEDCEICVPKHEVYDDYRLYCESHNMKPLCPADFGKVMKCVFPSVKPRRLGQRGQSKYCYSGLRKKLEVQPPALPDLEISPKKEKEEKNEEDEVYTASRQLVCEWAHKLLGSNFTNLRELAEFLVGNLYVNSKSTAAFTVLAAMQDAGLHNSKVPISSLFTCSSGGNKHKETQLQLQRKLQERELIKEQKRKIQQQRSEIERENEQLRSQTASVSPSFFQSPVMNAARNITKLLHSPGAGDCTLKSSPQQFQQIIRHNRDRKAIDESADTTFNDHSGMEIQMNMEGHSCKQSDSGQFHVVKKPAVRQASQSGDVADNKNIQTEVEGREQTVESHVSADKACENAHIALPTTPSRSAFVPVSNQRKDQTDTEQSNMVPADLAEEKEVVTMDAGEMDVKANLKTSCLSSILQEYKSERKSVSPPLALSNDTLISIPSSPHTPKKSRSRFTPIRPKVTPSKTVSSILKDHKNANGDVPAYDSRPVSTILKEKRAREAQEILVQLASNVQLQTGQLTQSSVAPVSTDILKLPIPTGTCSQANEVFIIVGSPKPGSTKLNAQSITMAAGGMDILGNSQFPPNVTAPVTQSTIPLALLLARQDEVRPQTGKGLDSNSLDNSDLSDNGNITDSEMPKSDESQEVVVLRDTDTPLGRKRKSSDRDIESKTKRMNSTDTRGEEEDVFLPHLEPPTSLSVAASASTTNRIIEDEFGTCNKIGRVLAGSLSVESLESDALLDTTPMAVDHNLVSSIAKPTLLPMQTASVGVSAKSMRPTQKQLLQQKLQLDQRVNNFFNKGHKSSKEMDAMSQQVKVIDKKRMEQLIRQYMQQHQKSDVKSSTNTCRNKTTVTPNNHPVNLLSLLQQPVFDCKKVILSSVSKTKVDDTNTDTVKNSDVNKDPVLNKIAQKILTVDQMDLESSDLPSDVADFITENMLAIKENASVGEGTSPGPTLEDKTPVTPPRLKDRKQRDQHLNEVKYESLSQSTVGNSTEQFTVPSTPPPPRLKSDVTNVKHKFAPFQRSSSLPVFAPPLSASFMSLGKGLDMPAPPNRVIDSSSPQPLHQKPTTPVNFTSLARQLSGRSRQTSSDRLSNHTPMSDAGYHSFDASPVMNSTPIPIMLPSDNIPNTSINTNTHIVNQDSAQSFASEAAVAQSPLPLISPTVPSTRSTPSSIVSPQIASQRVSPCENMNSPNSFMPIQGGISTVSSPLGSPQLVTPIKPLVTVATSPNSTCTSATFNSSILMKNSLQDQKDCMSSLHNFESTENSEEQKNSKHSALTMEHKEPNMKTGVLQKLLNSTSLPSYEEAVNNLGRGVGDNIDVAGISGSNAESLHHVGMVPQPNSVSLCQSFNMSDQNMKNKQESNSVLKEVLACSSGTAGPDSKIISTSEYPFSYQLALLREKCLNPSGKENRKKDMNGPAGQSVQKKSSTSEPSDPKKTFSENNVPGIESEENMFGNTLDTSAGSGQTHNKTSVTHHHYGSNVQKSSTSVSINASVSVSNTYVRSKSSATVIRPSAHLRTFSSCSVPSVPSVTSVSTAGKQRQLTTAVFPTFDLPNVNYMGNAPNIDLGSILQSKQSSGVGLNNSCDGAGGEQSRLTLMQALQPTQTINEEELQSTLEILRSLDSQYFSQSDLDLDTMHPCAQQPSQQPSYHSPAAQATDTHVSGSAPSSVESVDAQEPCTSKRSYSYQNDVTSR